MKTLILPIAALAGVLLIGCSNRQTPPNAVVIDFGKFFASITLTGDWELAETNLPNGRVTRWFLTNTTPTNCILRFHGNWKWVTPEPTYISPKQVGILHAWKQTNSPVVAAYAETQP